MNYESFFERCVAKYPQEKSFESIFKKIAEVFADEQFNDTGRIYRLFFVTGNRLGKSQFYRVKRYVKELYRWLYELGVATSKTREYVESLTLTDVLSADIVRHRYFKNLDDALDFVGAVGTKCGYGQGDALLAIKTIVILLWHGVHAGDIVRMKKADIKDSFVIANKTKIDIDERYLKVIKEYACAETYIGFPKGDRVHSYAKSIYLIRNWRSDRMAVYGVTRMLSWFNELAEEYFGRRLEVKSLMDNGMFCKMFADQNAIKDIEYTIGDDAKVFWYRRMYEEWKKVYCELEVG